MKPALKFLPLMLALFVISSRASSAAEAPKSCAIADVVTAADVARCLTNLEQLEAWKDHWQINDPGFPAFHVRFRPADSRVYMDYLTHRGPQFFDRMLSVERATLETEGHYSRLVAPPSEGADNTRVESVVDANGTHELRDYRARWAVARAFTAAMEAELRKRSAEHDAVLKTLPQLAPGMSLPELQAINREHDWITYLEATVAEEKNFIAALDAVEAKYRTLTLERYVKPLAGIAADGWSR